MNKIENLKRARLSILNVIMATPPHDPLQKQLNEMTQQIEEIIADMSASVV